MSTRNPDPAGFGVYIHWPFCQSKCPYCDFNSHVRHGGVDETAFRKAYLRDIRRHRELTGPRDVSSIFFGGGTPSLMEPATVGAILDEIGRFWSIDPDAEITLEANPSSVEAGRFAGYRAAGVNRVSLGVQSLIDDDLKALGRLHTAGEARAAIEIAARTFERYSFDLIYARPGQKASQWQRELGDAIAIGPGHLSLYQLTIEDGTPFADLHARGRLRVPASREAAELFELTAEITSAAGLAAYEISNHARPGQQCRHNLLYWRYGEYAGIGPGAHGRIIADGRRTATSTVRRPEAWREAVEMTGTGVNEREILTTAEQADELLLMGLRLAEGLDLGRLASIGGVRPGRQSLQDLIAEDWLVHDAETDRLRTTAEGRFVLNEIVLQLAADLEPVSNPSPGSHQPATHEKP